MLSLDLTPEILRKLGATEDEIPTLLKRIKTFEALEIWQEKGELNSAGLASKNPRPMEDGKDRNGELDRSQELNYPPLDELFAENCHPNGNPRKHEADIR